MTRRHDQVLRGSNGVPPLVVAGLAVQLVGIGAQALFHLSGDGLPRLTEKRTAAIDHVLSNAGVLALLWQVGRWARARPTRSNAGVRTIVIGAGLQTAGAVADGIGHAVGGEHRLPLIAIGTGYLTATAGAAHLAISAKHGGRS